jgi:outer membrane protein OmpA-like peptidoglycan-associated protein
MTVLAFALCALAVPKSAGQALTSTNDPSAPLQDLLFDFDQYNAPTNSEALRINAEWLKAHPDVHFYVQGYTDPRGEIVYNLALAQRRADTVRALLLDAGIPADRILFTTGWGKLYQTCPDSTDECWYRNRRVVLDPEGGGQLALDQSSNSKPGN